MRPYYHGNGIKIYHGDCREILPELPKVPLVLTDPPYAIGAGRGEWSATAAVAIGLHEAAKRVSKGGALLAFTTTSGRGIEFTQGSIAGKLPFNRLLTWCKTDGRSRAVSPWRWDSVAILAFGSVGSTATGSSSVYQTPADYERETDHPAELPDGIADWLYAPFGTDCLDPFMGTGRLLEPAVGSGKHVIGIELDERYCEIAAQRFDKIIRNSFGGSGPQETDPHD